MKKYDVATLNSMNAYQLNQVLRAAQTYNNRIQAANMAKANSIGEELSMEPMFTGDLDDLNRLIWPYFYPTEMILVPAQGSVTANITVSNEAPFSVMRMSRAVFEYEDLGGGTFNLTYIKPSVDVVKGTLDGLSYQLVDSQSKRSWSEEPISLDYIGDGKCPHIFDEPFLINPNNNLEVRLYNDTDKSYFVSVTMFGYKIRVEDAKNIITLVTN